MTSGQVIIESMHCSNNRQAILSLLSLHLLCNCGLLKLNIDERQLIAVISEYSVIRSKH